MAAPANKPTRILATLTVYQDYRAAHGCLEAIEQQTLPVDGVLLIDNSTEIDQSFREQWEKQWGNRLVYRHHPENIGVAGALRDAFQWAREEGADGLWTFDQDSEPDPHCLAHLVDGWSEEVPEAIRGPVISEVPGGGIHYGGCFEGYRYRQMKELRAESGETECDLIITAGMLIPASLFQVWAGPNPRLFIDAVDTRICQEAQSRGHRVVIRHDSFLRHRFGQPARERPGKTPIHAYTPLRHYYIGRNHTFVEKRWSRGPVERARCLLHRLKVAGRFSANTGAISHPQRWACIRAIWRGTWHGWRQDLDQE